MLRVGYDAQTFLSPNGGTGKGLQLRNLLGRHIDNFTGFASTAPNRSERKFIQEGASRYNVWQQTSLPRSLQRHKIDLFLSPENTAPFLLPSSTRLILVLHDTIQFQGFRQPTFRLRMMEAYRRAQIRSSVSRAEIVLTVSAYSRSEILRLFPKANVRVIPCTIPESWFDPVAHDTREEYLLLVTSSAPHKNAAGAIGAYAQYVRISGQQAAPLRVIGLSQEEVTFRRIADGLGLGNLITFLPFLPEDALRSYYRKARAVIVPSYAEGFGIPVLEAMATGAPVLTSRAASLPEVGGAAPMYFDPHKPEEIALSIATLAADPSVQQRMTSLGLQQAQKFHPTAISRLVDEFWQETAYI